MEKFNINIFTSFSKKMRQIKSKTSNEKFLLVMRVLGFCCAGLPVTDRDLKPSWRMAAPGIVLIDMTMCALFQIIAHINNGDYWKILEIISLFGVIIPVNLSTFNNNKYNA